MSKSLKELLAEQQAMLSSSSSRPNRLQEKHVREASANTVDSHETTPSQHGRTRVECCPSVEEARNAAARTPTRDVDEGVPPTLDADKRKEEIRLTMHRQAARESVCQPQARFSGNLTLDSAATREPRKNIVDARYFTHRCLDDALGPRELPPYFLFGSPVTSIKGTDLGEVSSLGEYFLAGCEVLESVEFCDALCRVKTIPFYFMAFCPLLRTIDCSSLVNVTTIGSHFAYGCASVTTVNLSGMCNVRKIGMSFLEGCISLTTLDASSFTALEHIDEGFLAECHSLEEVSLLNCTKVATIESNFLLNCHELRFVDLPVFRLLRELVPPAFHGCQSLHSVNQRHFPSIAADDLLQLVDVPLVGEVITEGHPRKVAVLRESRDSSNQRQPQSLLMSLPIESFATIYSFLSVNDSASLRSSCSSTVDAFNMAVELEYYIPCAGSENPNAADPMTNPVGRNSRWFPMLQPMWSASSSSRAVRARSLSCLLDSSLNFARICSVPQQISGVYSLRVRARGSLQWLGQCPVPDCQSLAIADIDCFQSASEIPQRFLTDCPSLHRLKLGASPTVGVLGDNFLSSAGRLLGADFLRGLPNLKAIGAYAFSRSAIRSIEISRLEFLAVIGNFFAFDCTNLGEVKLEHLPSLRSIGKHFLYRCHGAFTLTFENLPCLQTIESDFLSRTGVQNVVFNGTPILSSIGQGFCKCCSTLKSVHMGKQPSLVKIASDFLADCASVLEVSLPELPAVSEIGNSFLSSCTSLSSVSLGSMPCLKIVSSFFLIRCANLRELRLEAPGAEVVQCGFLNDCSSLTSLDVSALPPRAEVAPNSLRNCDNLQVISVSRQDFFPRDIIAAAAVHVTCQRGPEELQ